MANQINHNSVSGAVRTFAYFVSAGSLGVDVLQGHDYRTRLMAEPWMMEKVFAVFVNNLQVDDMGNVTNRTAADRRAASWLLACLDPSKQPEIPFTEAELALY